MIVLVFVMLFLAMLGTAWRQLGSVLRIETVRAKQMTRDQGSLKAAAKALRLLEMTADRSLINNGDKYKYEADGQCYEVEFLQDGNEWTVTATAVSGDPGYEDIPYYLPEPVP